MTNGSAAWYEKKTLWSILVRVGLFVGILAGITTIARTAMQQPWDYWPFALIFVISGIMVIVAWYFYDQSVRRDYLVNLKQQHEGELEQRINELGHTLDEASKRIEELTKTFDEQLRVTAEKLHFAIHDVRNAFDDLLRLDTNTLTPTGIEGPPVQLGIKVVNYLAELLTLCVGEPVCVCIKILNRIPDTQGELVAPSYDDLTVTDVETMCRSTNTPKPRFEQNLHSITGNTAFLDIMYNGNPYFAKSDLIEEAAQGRYANTTPNWDNYYRSAIVVPIRIQIGTVDNIRGQRPVYDILAFLCADTRESNGFGQEKLSTYADLLMVVGDAMFHYLDMLGYLKTQLVRPPALTE